VMGEVAQAVCMTSERKVVDMTAEDTAVAIYRFTSGAVAEMTGTFGLPVGPAEHRVTFYGPGGYAEISSKQGTVGLSEEKFGDRKVHPLLGEHEWGTGFKRLWEDYARGFSTGSDTRVTAEDGKRAVEMILAAYESAKTGQVVKLPL
jgi:UDP-N-acetyl-2-amino-2-deoxyglucuronate dehydrogenase